MNYHCDICDYKTSRKSSFNNHLNSRRHIEKKLSPVTHYAKPRTPQEHPKNTPQGVIYDKLESEYICEFCFHKFTRICGLSRHLKNCPLKKERISDINELKSKLDDKDETIKELKNLVVYFQGILGKATNILDKTMTAYSYANQRYPQPTLLVKPPTYELLFYNDDYPKINNAENKNDKLVSTLAYEYSKKRLPNYIGDFVVRLYKKEGDEVKYQSMWNSDTARLNYIIGERINKENMWNVDKKGKKVKELVIKPTLGIIKPILQEFINKMNKDNRLSKIKNKIKLDEEMDKLKYSSKIIQEIDEGVLAEAVLKYISPFFYLKKDDAN